MLCSSLGRRGAGGLGVGACARCAQVVSPRPKSFLLWSKPRDCPCSYCMCARARDLGFAFCCAAATAEASCNQGSQAACASVRHAEMVRRVTRLCLVSHRHFAYVILACGMLWQLWRQSAGSTSQLGHAPCFTSHVEMSNVLKCSCAQWSCFLKRTFSPVHD